MSPSTLVLGLGNPILSDDTIGLHIVNSAEKQLKSKYKNITFIKNFSGSFDLLHDIAGYQRLIIIDSIETNNNLPGHCYQCTPDNFVSLTQSCLVNWHSINLPTLLKIGELFDFKLPKQIILYGIEGHDFTSFSEQPTLELNKIIQDVVNKLDKQLALWCN